MVGDFHTHWYLTLPINFRLVSDVYPYANHRERTHRLKSLAARQLKIVGILRKDDGDGNIPITKLTSCASVL